MKHIIAFISVLLLLSACSTQSTYEDVSVEKAQEMIANNVTVIDVRTEEEYAAGHIPNALLMPLHELENRLGELNKGTEYVIVCRSGNRSAQASKILVDNGFTSIFNMLGGMNQWTGEVVTE
ncbi:rhodanese-like domain-containing protein [Bacillus sp. HMF5848]|uniref:rhodanese-like domain-containing protein n=1 Tax=Bacillus sp. HMF5848 TaxID=2495421 RepID=UPI000F7AE0E1|nr:rhodanese-like domain-containing protein [Bacillus sp. HMF5848]RSK28276.1 rhodanese-like domain-containing protein [Bacillus sp. HMF5848]